MKQFLKNIPGQIAGTFTIMMSCFTVVSFCKGVEAIPMTILPELMVLSAIGGIWMEFAFGTGVIKNMPDAKRICLFIIPFALITFLCAVVFRWITELDVIGTYVKFITIFLVCWLISVGIMELEHSIRGKRYTEKLRKYQNGGTEDEP